VWPENGEKSMLKNAKSKRAPPEWPARRNSQTRLPSKDAGQAIIERATLTEHSPGFREGGTVSVLPMRGS